MRVFVGCRTSPEIRQYLRAAWERIPSQPVGLRPLQDASWHLSIAFLGEVNEAFLERIQQDTETWSTRVRPLRLEITRFVTFPPKHPRYLAAHVEVESFHAIASSIDRLRDLLSVYAPAIDRKPWRPHISMGKGRNNVALPRWALDIESIFWSPTELALIRSEPGPVGSVYSNLATFPLP